jgi:hypothetical protein
MEELEIPSLVKRYGKISPAWKNFDLELLHKMSRRGKTLGEIANLLPCLWFFQSSLREPILRRFVEDDQMIGRCVHENVGSGQITYLEFNETDLVLNDQELQEFSNDFAALCDGLRSLPRRDCQSLLNALDFAIREVKIDNAIEARTLTLQVRKLAVSHPPSPRKRRPFQKTP